MKISTLPPHLKTVRAGEKLNIDLESTAQQICLIYMFVYLMNFPFRPAVLATLFCSPSAREFIYFLFPFLFILRNYVALFFFSLLFEAMLLT
jgi:hypothetical protein